MLPLYRLIHYDTGTVRDDGTPGNAAMQASNTPAAMRFFVFK